MTECVLFYFVGCHNTVFFAAASKIFWDFVVTEIVKYLIKRVIHGVTAIVILPLAGYADVPLIAVIIVKL